MKGNFLNELQKRGVNIADTIISTEDPRANSYLQEYKKRKKQEEELGPVGMVGTLASLKNDIGPVKDDEGLDFFQKGAFSDGYQLGDVTKTILGTAGDIGLNVTRGVGGLAEGLTDIVQYGAAGLSDLFGAYEAADKIRAGAKKNVVEDLTKGAGNYLDQYSVLGKTSDAIAQGLGQVGAIMLTGGLAAGAGLSATAVTTGTMFASGMGSGISQAYQGGADDKEAYAFGAISGAADAITELIFGAMGKSVNAVGFSKGLSSADDMLAKKISGKISNQLAKNLVEFGVKASGEGFEEVLAGTLQAAGKKATYMSEQEFSDILEDENLLEQFIVGAATSGVMQSGLIPGTQKGSLIEANKQGKDFITGQTVNEQAVIKKEIEKRIAEQEKDGRKLTAREKSAIEAQVEADLPKGYISTDTIEEVLGGDDFKAYKDTIDSEDALKKEYETLLDLKEDDVTVRQRKRLTEIESLLPDIEKGTKRNDLKTKLSESVAERAKVDRLVESYNERARKGQAFEADVTKYDAKQQAVIRKAIDSGILNNTNRTHDFVDFVAKISAEKGVPFDFTNNAKLKESGFAVDGKTVNGYVTKDGIAVNIQAAKSLNSVVGHEITHVLEGTEFYDVLQKSIIDYAKAKGDYRGRYDTLAKLYEGVEGANVDAELTADLVGDYLFTDTDFISRLSAENRNVFQKIYDEVKYLLKVATAGSKEARELERVKHLFEKAYKDSATKNTTEDGGVKYSLESVDGTDYVRAEKNIFVKEDGTVATEREVFNSLVGKTIHLADGDVKIVKRLPDMAMYNELVRRWPKNLNEVDNAKQLNKSVNYNMEELLANSEMKDPDLPDTDGRHQKQGITGFDTRTVKFYDGDRAYDIEFSIAALQNGEKVAYAKRFFGYDAELTKKIQTAEGRSEESPFNQQSVFDNTVPQNGNDVKTKLSISDSEGRQLSKEQAEYFKDSKVRDADGKLLKVYHGTPDKFTTFKQGVADGWGKGIYFTDNKAEASTYGENVVEAYLNITNPYNADTMNYYDIGAENTKAYRDYDMEVWKKQYDEYDTYEEYKADGMGADMHDIYREEVEVFNKILRELGYDGIIADGSNGIDGLEIVAFRENQPKLTSNKAPTADPDIRYSLSTDSEGNQLSVEQAEYFKNSKARDRNGNLLKVYHTTQNDFTVFDKSKKGETTGDYNTYLGFFFADTPEYMNQFPEFKDGKTETYYLNMTNPIDMNNISKQAFLDIVEATGGDIQEAAELYDSEYAAEVKRAKFRGDNSTIMEMSRLLEDLTGEYFDYAEFYNALKPNYDRLMAKGYDGIINTLDGRGWANEYIVLDSNQAKLTTNTKPTVGPDIRRSISDIGEEHPVYGNYSVYGKDIALEGAQDVAPVQDSVQTPVQNPVQDILPDDYAPAVEETADMQSERLDSLTEADMPAEVETEYLEMADAIPLTQKVVKDIAKSVKGMLGLSNNQVGEVYSIVLDYSGREFPSREALFQEIAERFGQYSETSIDEELKQVKAELRAARVSVDDAIKNDITDYGKMQRSNFGKIRFSKEGLPVDVVYMEFAEKYPGYFPEDIINPSDQLQRMIEVANYEHTTEQSYELDDDTLLAVTDSIINAVNEFRTSKRAAIAQRTAKESFNALMPVADEYAPPMDGDIGPVAKPKADTTERTEKKVGPRQALHQNIMDRIKTRFEEKGLDLYSVLKNAKNLSTFATVDNTPQRVNEKTFGYKAGQLMNDLTVDQVARNETEGIKWLNQYTDRKNGLLKKISDRYNIKPGTDKSAAAQMYAEGFYVAENGDIIEYGDAELAKDFPNAQDQADIKGLAKEPLIRQIYDETLALINDSRTKNAYPEIQKLNNYFLHFRAMGDTFSKWGLPFNPNDIRAKDLPTDLNGVTADLKPGQPYFASAMHRKGQRTSFDLLGGLEMYLTSAMPQIYHIGDIQTHRALRNFIADTFGQANGLEGLDNMTEEEAQERIEQVYGSHLSTYAKFLNEEANVLAGKTALIDRGLEGIIGRRGMTFLDTVNRQVGANMVGYNVSSSLTNFLAPVQAFAKTNKADFMKAFSQTVYNKLASINGNGDGFAEQSSVMIRRKGADRFHRTFWQKLSDPGYALMGAVDSFSTELIARAKYNEFTRKGMDAEQAHIEADKWTSRLMGDRSLGQQPHLYNSKMLGIVTKFQLEVRNQLDSQFYDTIQEAKVSNEDIQNARERNAKTAAKVASTFFQLAVGQHLFGKVFESIAGYNPAFDIIEALAKAFGWDDDEEDEDTVLDNIGQGFMSLMEDMPYSSVLTGGRIPIQSALPISEFFKGKDQYGNEKSRLETLSEAAPYYLLPGGYGQIKKTVAGMNMFSDEHPVAGSYTDSGNLRFPVEDTLLNRAQAAVFGQYASSNARDYFDNERQSLKKNQIQEFVDVDIPIRDYWEYRDGLKKQETLEDKFDYIAGLDLPISKKNILINNVVDRKEPVDLSDYDAYSGYEEFDFATKNPEKYAFFEEVGISYSAYKNGDDDTKDAYDWAYNNPDKYLLSKAAASDVVEYRRYTKDLYDIKADKDASGKTISGSRKEKVIQYINNLDIDYGERLILFKSEYEADDTYNADIVEYLNGRDDISFEEEVTILKELGFIVLPDGTVQW